jgi:hypothetical protein
MGLTHRDNNILVIIFLQHLGLSLNHSVTWKYVFLMTFKTVSLNAMYAIIIDDAFSIKLLKIYRKTGGNNTIFNSDHCIASIQHR